MPSASEWKVPASVQPKPEDYGYDLDAALSAVVGIRAIIPGDAFTAETLGTERAGNGVLIRADGLVLTIGYLVTEAADVWLTVPDGRELAAHPPGEEVAEAVLPREEPIDEVERAAVVVELEGAHEATELVLVGYVPRFAELG